MLMSSTSVPISVLRLSLVASFLFLSACGEAERKLGAWTNVGRVLPAPGPISFDQSNAGVFAGEVVTVQGYEFRAAFGEAPEGQQGGGYTFTAVVGE